MVTVAGNGRIDIGVSVFPVNMGRFCAEVSDGTAKSGITCERGIAHRPIKVMDLGNKGRASYKK